MKIVYQILLLSVLGLCACRPAGPKVVKAESVKDLAPFDPSTQQTMTRLGVGHVKHFLESNPEALVLDVRPSAEYDKAHLPGAVSFPYDFKNSSIEKELEVHSDYTPKKIYFTYGSKENFYAIDVVSRLNESGYQYLYSMNGGIEDWVKLGLPVESAGVAK